MPADVAGKSAVLEVNYTLLPAASRPPDRAARRRSCAAIRAPRRCAGRWSCRRRGCRCRRTPSGPDYGWGRRGWLVALRPTVATADFERWFAGNDSLPAERRSRLSGPRSRPSRSAPESLRLSHRPGASVVAGLLADAADRRPGLGLSCRCRARSSGARWPRSAWRRCWRDCSGRACWRRSSTAVSRGPWCCCRCSACSGCCISAIAGRWSSCPASRASRPARRWSAAAAIGHAASPRPSMPCRHGSARPRLGQQEAADGRHRGEVGTTAARSRSATGERPRRWHLLGLVVTRDPWHDLPLPKPATTRGAGRAAGGLLPAAARLLAATCRPPDLLPIKRVPVRAGARRAGDDAPRPDGGGARPYR